MQGVNMFFNEESALESSTEIVYEEKKVYELLKRGFDIFFAITIGIISVPIILITCIFVMIESKGLPIYKQERLGKNGEEFTIYKIRSMRMDAENGGPKWASENDERITKVGKFIRKTRLDELPQLLNLLIGDMTLIGPRPERRIFTEQFENLTPGFKKRLAVKPGLTGYAQVSGGYDLNHEEKLKYDLEYIKNRSIILDIKILFKTIKVILTGDGAR